MQAELVFLAYGVVWAVAPLIFLARRPSKRCEFQLDQPHVSITSPDEGATSRNNCEASP